MPVQLKICGLSTEASLDAAIAAGAAFVGLVYFAPSPRHVDAARAAALAHHARGRAAVTLLTVDMDGGRLAELVDAVRPDVLQLHGSETPECVAHVRSAFGRPVWKAVALSERADLAVAALYGLAADRILFDAKPPRGADRPGGNGRAFDWRLLAGAGPGFALSGGLEAGNVGLAVSIARPDIVDVSSGVESEPGIKDPRRIAAFAAALRAAEILPERRAS